MQFLIFYIQMLWSEKMKVIRAAAFLSVYATSHMHSLEKLKTNYAAPEGLICMQIPVSVIKRCATAFCTLKRMWNAFSI